MKKRRGRATPPLLFVLLTLLTCALAVGLVLLSARESIPSSADAVSAPQESAVSLREESARTESAAPPESAPSEGPSSEPASGAVSSREVLLPESSEAVSSREYYNPSVSSPRSQVVPGSAELGFTEQEQADLDALLASYGGHVSVYFQDITSGASYEYDADRHYFVASLIKAPYCMYLFQLAEEGRCSLNELITVTEEDKQEGTGDLKDMEDLPKDFTVRELMALAIRKSDNTAMKLLLRRYPSGGYRDYAVGLGIEHADDIRYVTNGIISAREAGVYLRAIYGYIENGKYGGELKSDMLGTTYYMIQSGYPVARKYGWTAGEGKAAYHDMAVVYAPHPYLLAICTDHQDGREKDRAMFGEISRHLETLWAEKYAAGS